MSVRNSSSATGIAREREEMLNEIKENLKCKYSEGGRYTEKEIDDFFTKAENPIFSIDFLKLIKQGVENGLSLDRLSALLSVDVNGKASFDLGQARVVYGVISAEKPEYSEYFDLMTRKNKKGESVYSTSYLFEIQDLCASGIDPEIAKYIFRLKRNEDVLFSLSSILKFSFKPYEQRQLSLENIKIIFLSSEDEKPSFNTGKIGELIEYCKRMISIGKTKEEIELGLMTLAMTNEKGESIFDYEQIKALTLIDFLKNAGNVKEIVTSLDESGKPIYSGEQMQQIIDAQRNGLGLNVILELSQTDEHGRPIYDAIKMRDIVQREFTAQLEKSGWAEL